MSVNNPGPGADPKLFPKPPEPLRYADGELDKLVKFYSDLQSQVFSQAVAYNNVVIGAGYAGAFALWNIVKGDLSVQASRWVVITLGISLLAFIAWNVFTMIWIAIERSAYGEATKGKTGEAYIAAFKRAESDTRDRYYRIYRQAWLVDLVVTIVTGSIGVSVLLWNVAAKLLVIE